METQSVDQHRGEGTFLGMNSNWQKASIVLAFVAQIALIFYWGGQINNKVENLQRQLHTYSQVSERQNVRIRAQASRISGLERDVAVAEALANACVSEGLERGTLNPDRLNPDG